MLGGPIKPVSASAAFIKTSERVGEEMGVGTQGRGQEECRGHGHWESPPNTCFPDHLGPDERSPATQPSMARWANKQYFIVIIYPATYVSVCPRPMGRTEQC